MSRHIARDALSRMNGFESLVAPAHVDALAENLRQLASVTDDSLEEAAAEKRLQHLADAYGYAPQSVEDRKPFVFADGVAIIPIHGTLINRFSYSWGFVTGYNFLRKQFNAAMSDDDVTLIVFDVNSNGGEAAGCFELAEEIREGRATKPTLAVVDTNCHSAAYALASACTSLVVTPSGSAGSIGVIAMHMSMEGMLDQLGIEVTIFSKGARKADGNPYKRLSREAISEIEASIDQRYDEFVDLVSVNRDLDRQVIVDTESRSYRAAEALELKLIDAVKTPTDAVSSFLAELGDDEPADDEDEPEMTTASPKSGDQAQATAPDTAAVAAQATLDTKARVKGILTHAEASGRGALANHLALETDLSVEAAGAILAAAPKEPEPTAAEKRGPDAATTAAAAPVKPGDVQGAGGQAEHQQAAGAGAFKEAMGASSQPNVGADTEADTAAAAAKPSRAKSAMSAAGMSLKEDARTQH